MNRALQGFTALESKLRVVPPAEFEALTERYSGAISSQPSAIGQSPLVQAALSARDRAHAPYSRFRVGAALEDGAGRHHTGCNVENATYGLTICAERVAVFKAISEGARDFRRIAIVADTDLLTPPCGACRQILWEFCGDIEIVLANLRGEVETLHLKNLFPRAFDSAFL